MHRVQERWPVAIVMLVVSAWVLGAVGFSRTDASCRIDDCLYFSLQLFGLEFASEGSDPPLELNVARFLAPLILGYAVVLALLQGARERATLWRLALWARNHVVVVGLTDVGLAAATEARKAKAHVVVVDAVPDPRLLRACRTRDIEVVDRYTEYAAMLKAARVDRAESVIISTGDDAANLRALAAVRELTSAVRAGSSYTEITDVRLWSALHSLPLARDPSASEEFFCPPDRAARIVLDHCRSDIDEAVAKGQARVLIYGQGPVAERLVVQTGRRLGLSAERHIQLVGSGAPRLLESVLEAAPWLEPAIGLADEGHLADVALVAGVPDAEALAVPSSLAKMSLRADGRVWAAVKDAAAMEAAALMDLDVWRVRLVPTTAEALATRLIEESAREVIARAKHEDYVVREVRRGVSPRDNPSLVPWSELPDSLRRSNRMFAASIGEKLERLGAGLEPLADDSTPAELQIDDTLLTELARGEHERWVRDLLADGWQLTDGPKDAERKLHPTLMEWERLSPTEQEKDRDAIRALPAMLALVGYRMNFSVGPRSPDAEAGSCA